MSSVALKRTLTYKKGANLDQAMLIAASDQGLHFLHKTNEYFF